MMCRHLGSDVVWRREFELDGEYTACQTQEVSTNSDTTVDNVIIQQVLFMTSSIAPAANRRASCRVYHAEDLKYQKMNRSSVFLGDQ
jgi:hypothetical protein